MKQLEDRKIYSVSEVNYFAKQTLEQMVIWVEGEVSSLKKNSNWSFYYLDLKDDLAVLPCIVTGYLVENLASDITGQKVIAFGTLSVYEPLGKYQLRVQSLELAGEGALAKKLEILIKKLKAEGLFERKHKKELPIYPKKVCVVTSQDSAAWLDFKTHTADKFPIIQLVTADVRVQGSQSIPSLLKVLPKVDKKHFDVIVITRGGGSIEDLAAFNNEQVARTIFKMQTPTIVAIGHEVNESLAEWVADIRASTPTDAANIPTSAYSQVLMTLESLKVQLKISSDHYFSRNLQTLDHYLWRLSQTKSTFKDLPHKLTTIKESLKRHEKYLITDAKVRLDNLLSDIKKNSQFLIKARKQELQSLKKSLILLSSENTLSRGYSITTDLAGSVIKSIDSIVVGSILGVKLARGSIKTHVKSKKND